MSFSEYRSHGIVTKAEVQRIEQFLNLLKDRGWRSCTISAYRTDWWKFANWYQQTNAEPFDLTRLTALDLNDYRNWGLEELIVDATVFRAIKDVGLVRLQELAPKALTQAEVRRLLKEVELRADSRDQAIVYTLLYTGLRVGELAHLKPVDVQRSERKGTIVVRGDHATGGRQREIPVPRTARQRLQTYLEQHPTDKSAVFLGQRGPLGSDALGRIVRKYASWAKLEGVTSHVLRHTFAYNYLKKIDNDLIGLSTILGHDSVTTTQIYTQKPLEALQDEIEKGQFF